MTARSTAQGNAATIRDETVVNANTATRVGSNLRELADGVVFTEDVPLLSDGSNLTSWAGPRICPPPMFDDFEGGGLTNTGSAAVCGATATSILVSSKNWRVATNSTGSRVDQTATNASSTHPGVVAFDIGTGAGGFSGLILNAGSTANMFIGSGQVFRQEWMAYWAVASDGTNTTDFYIGWITAIGAAPTDGIYFHINANASANILAKSTKAGAGTTTFSGGSNVTATAAAWHRLTLDWNGTTATAMADGTVIGTSAANIPVNAIGPGGTMIRSAGSTSGRIWYVDYVYEARAWAAGRSS